MSPNKLNSNLTSSLHCLSSWDFKLVLGIVTLLATASAFQGAYSLGYTNGQEALDVALSATYPPGIYTNFDFLHWLNAMHIGIAVGLIVATIGLWSRRATGFLFSILALVWVCMVYAWWYRGTLHFLKNIEVTEYTKLHDPFFKEMGILRGASRWDVLILLMAVTLLLWQLKTLLRILRSSRKVKLGSETGPGL